MKPTREASAIAKFRLLMWKNYLQQWRNPMHTLMDMAFPIVAMSIVLVMRSMIQPAQRSAFTFQAQSAYNIYHPNTLSILLNMNISALSVAYSPTSPVLEDVVISAIATMLRNNDVLIPGIFPDFNHNSGDVDEVLRNLIKVEGYEDSADLARVYYQEEAVRTFIAGVQFSDSLQGATTLPSDVSYSLRFPQRPRLNSFYFLGSRSWRTDEVFPSFTFPGPRQPFEPGGGSDPGYVYEMFLALQHAISSELTARLTGADMSEYNVNIRRYPHPAYEEDLAVTLLQFMLPMLIMISFSFPVGNIVRTVVIEKEMQLKESMKIMGLSTWLHWTAWFFKQFTYLLVVVIIFVILLKVNWFSTPSVSEYAVLTNTPWHLLFCFLVLYLAATILFCFMISTFFSKASTAAMFTGMIWFIAYLPAFILAADLQTTRFVQGLMCLSLNTGMALGLQLMMANEAAGGLQWGNLLSNATVNSDQLLLGHVMIIMACDCILYLLITLYVEKVSPGPFGVPQPWYFPFQRSFWCPNPKVSPDDYRSDNDHDIVQENDPTDLAIGVKISELTKIFKQTPAVDNFSLNIYNDQITVLLGHNGAGKSTVMSMLTGNLEPTSGTATVAGYDIRLQMAAARAHIGFCPQHNVLFQELTVREHLEFFARLKGFSGKEMDDNIDSIIVKLELHDKRNWRSSGLSGGQKRRLSVGVALCGSSHVVLLDEPTSGMDPSSRRALWDMLQREKKGRSIILTTHFMDEADILGDRVAIMAGGRLQCVGSPYFLKQHYGVGYTLVVVKGDNFSEATCSKLINKYIPGVTVKEDRGTEVTYSLSNDYSHSFENILNDLESNTSSIGFTNYGLDATTLEDVFMSVGSDMSPTLEANDRLLTGEAVGNGQTSVEELFVKSNLVSGAALVAQHVRATWLKLWLVWSRSWGLLLLQVLVPIFFMSITLLMLRFVIRFEATPVARPLSLAEGYFSTESWLESSGDTGPASLGALASEAFKTIFEEADPNVMAFREVDQPLEQYYLEQGADPVTMSWLRNRVLIGATFSDAAATAWFSNFGYHDVATSLATVHAAILRALRPDATMHVANHPLEAAYVDQSDRAIMVAVMSLQVATAIANSLSLISAVFIVLYIKERNSRAKLLQQAAGAQPVVLWGAAAVFDWLWFLLACLAIVITCVAFQVVGFSTGIEIGRLYVCLMLYGAAMLPFNYIFSNLFSKPSTGFMVMYFINIIIGMVGNQVMDALMTPGFTTEDAGRITDQVLQFFPLYSAVAAIRGLNTMSLHRWSCLELCGQLQVALGVPECTMAIACSIIDTCCVRENSYFDWEAPGVARYLAAMAATCVVLWAILMLIEYRIIHRLFTRRRVAPKLEESALDEDVLAERRHVDHIANSALGQENLVAMSLTKYYGKQLAVNQVSFSVGQSECFGLLGVNGAGKTSTFKMLMGDESVSNGNAFVRGHSVKSNLGKVHENIGYCPQFDAVFDELTGRETLRMYALLRGLKPDAIPALTHHLADTFGFTQHLDKQINQFSGGNKRKLSTAVSMLGRSGLVFLDEPTTGVDPAAKRQVWRAIRHATHSGRGVVLTSHSMEECEALCSRLTIMVNGQFQCFGTPQHLKNKFSQGYVLTIKMKINNETRSEETGEAIATSGESSTEDIKAFIESKFQEPTLREEYKGLLTYYLRHDDMPWSRMFAAMELAKRELRVEDYSISQTTLEQIFLQFTKYQWQFDQQVVPAGVVAPN